MTSSLVLTPVATDNFTRANATIAGANNWLAISSGSMAVVSNEAKGAAGVQQGDYRTSETYSSDQYSQIAVGSVALVSGGYIGASVRNQDSKNCYLLIYFYDGANYYLQMFKKVGATPTYTMLFQNALGAAPLAAATTITLIAEGTTLQIWLGTTPYATIKDATFPSGGVPGIESFNANSLDNWVGGNAATGALGAALATDNFNRADGNVSVGNANWTLMHYPYGGGATVEVPIVSNQLSTQNPPVAFHAGNVRTDAYASDHWSQLQLGTAAMNISGFVGLVTRNQGSGGTLGNSGYLFTAFQGEYFEIYRLDNGNSILLGSIRVADAAAGTIYTYFGAGASVTGVSEGTRHSLRVNGSEVLAVTDATYSGGAPGIMTFGNSTADNWSAGPVATGGGGGATGILNPQQIGLGGTPPIYQAATAVGDEFVPSPRTFIHIKNGGASSITATFKAYGSGPGGNPVVDRVVTVPAGSERMAGPFDRAGFMGSDWLGQISYSGTTSVLIAALQI